MNKKFLVLFFGILVLVFMGYDVLATTNFTVPVAYGNYSATLNITLNTDVTNSTNTTCYYNSSGGAATTWLTEILNDTSDDVLFNDSVSLSSFTEAATYNISCTVQGDTNEAASLADITIDNTAPSVNASKISGVSYSTRTRANGTFVLNVSVSDTINATTVFFNLTNASGVQDAIYYAAREGASNYWSNTTGFNISKFTEGAYTITVYANDSVNNLNSTEDSGTIYLDSTSPSSVTLTLSSHGASSLIIDIVISDNVGIGSSCTVDRSGASITGTGTTQTLTETSLGCSHTYSYVVTCTDHAGNSKSSDSTSFTTASCADGSGTSGTTSQWTGTYVVTDSDFENGYSKKLSAKQRMKVSLGSETHYVGVKSLTTSSATIEISSNPVEATLNVGDEKKFDLNSDGYYDLDVKLLGIDNSKAEISVQKINEEIPAGGNSEATTTTSGEETQTGGETTSTTGEETIVRSLTWLWVLIGIFVVACALFFFFRKKMK